MSLHNFYPQSVLTEQATLTDLTGTSATRYNMLNYRRGSRCDVDTVSGGVYTFLMDMGAGNIVNPDFVALIDHNLLQETANLLIRTCSGDSAGGPWDETWLSGTNAAAGDEPIWYETLSPAPNGVGRRYWNVQISSIADTAYWGCFFLGDRVLPGLDPNYGEPQQRDYSGTTVNTSIGGNRFAIQRYGTRPIYGFHYELVTTACKDILLGLETTVGGPLKSFIFSLDEGGVTTLKYGRLSPQGMQVTEAFAGLWDVRFFIEEEI